MSSIFGPPLINNSGIVAFPGHVRETGTGDVTKAILANHSGVLQTYLREDSFPGPLNPRGGVWPQGLTSDGKLLVYVRTATDSIGVVDAPMNYQPLVSDGDSLPPGIHPQISGSDQLLFLAGSPTLTPAESISFMASASTRSDGAHR